MKLTESQLKAVKAKEGNFLVHAGSGSGKTSSFVARIANLIMNENVSPSSILGLTFTREAAENMRTRLTDLVGESFAKMVHLSTFHSFAYGFMKENFPSHYNNKSLMKSWWKIKTIYDIHKELELDVDPHVFQDCISLQKTYMIREGEDIHMDGETVTKDNFHELQRGYNLYCKRTREARLYEFDDMLVDLYYSLKNNKELKDKITSQYQYVMVDEFQDTNHANMMLLKEITDNNLFVVGDFRQGIYSFINADVNNILNFQDEFEDVTLVELNENFRSTNQIVDFANDIINSSPVEKYKQFHNQIPAREIDKEKVKMTVFPDESKEIESIIERVNELRSEHGLEYKDFAIILRTNNQLAEYESVFADHSIPVDVSTSKSFFDRREIVDLLSYAQHVIDPDNDISINRIMNTPNRYISNKVIADVATYAFDKDVSYEDAARQVNMGRYTSNIRKVPELFDKLREELDNMSTSNFLQYICDKSGLVEHIEKTALNTIDAEMKTGAIDKLIGLSKKFSDLEAFLGHVEIIKKNNGKNANGLKLMTVHASKGLEFPVVFLPSLTNNNFPHDMNGNVEEERRLFYVASTRAKDHMEISAPLFANNDGHTYDISPFIEDVTDVNLGEIRRSVMRDNTPQTFVL